MNTLTITIPKGVSRQGELVAIPKKELARLLERACDSISEKDVLRWSREARARKRAGKLPVLHSLGVL